MPYRERPTEEFDPTKHVMVDDKSYVRKSAADAHKAAEKEAALRNEEDANENKEKDEERQRGNVEFKGNPLTEKSWFKKLFSRKSKIPTGDMRPNKNIHTLKKADITALDILYEDALIEHLEGLQLDNSQGVISGTFNDVPVRLWPRGRYSQVDGVDISEEDGKFLYNKFYPMLKQRSTDAEAKKIRDKKRAERGAPARLAINKLLGPRRPKSNELADPEIKLLTEDTEDEIK